MFIQGKIPYQYKEVLLSTRAPLKLKCNKNNNNNTNPNKMSK